MPGGRFNPVNSLRFVDPMVNECFEITGNLALTVVLRVRSHGENNATFCLNRAFGMESAAVTRQAGQTRRRMGRN
jgi:hypothetical protein